MFTKLIAMRMPAVWLSLFVSLPVLAQERVEREVVIHGERHGPGPFGFAGGFAGPAMRSPENRLLGLLRSPQLQKQLALTEEQQQKLEEIGFNAAKASIQQGAELRVRRLELSRLMNAQNPDRAAIDKKLQEIEQIQTALARSLIHARLDGGSVLTEEQREKVQQLLRQRMPSHPGRHREMRRGPGPGGRPGHGRMEREGRGPRPRPAPPAPPQPPPQGN